MSEILPLQSLLYGGDGFRSLAFDKEVKKTQWRKDSLGKIDTHMLKIKLDLSLYHLPILT